MLVLQAAASNGCKNCAIVGNAAVRNVYLDFVLLLYLLVLSASDQEFVLLQGCFSFCFSCFRGFVEQPYCEDPVSP